MKSSEKNCLLFLRRVCKKLGITVSPDRALPTRDCGGKEGNNLIKSILERRSPTMICRFGGHELKATVRRYELVERGNRVVKALRYVLGRRGPPWWDDYLREKMTVNAGLFPGTDEMLDRFGDRMLEDLPQIDVLGSWRPGETRIRHLFPQAKLVDLRSLEPYYHAEPWSAALAGKMVLVVHPFADTIRKQYLKRKQLFSNPDILPDFDLKTVRAVYSAANAPTDFSNWFEALRRMCDKIDEHQFDVAIIGAGAYGLPIAAHVKRSGKIAVHMGGGTQILFGIKGTRWDDHPYISKLYNEHWTRPSAEETPEGFKRVEEGCYW